MNLNILPIVPQPLLTKILAVQAEDAAYAADELVDLGEEILSQLAAMGFAAYLKQSKQKEVYNDFLISLFLSNGHSYNAGPLYRWAANMIKDAEGDEVTHLYPFFWQETKKGVFTLNEEIYHFASLRNAVMHGFFVLPPERNIVEAHRMEIVLNSMQNAKLFETNWGQFHFLNKTYFNGQWNIKDKIDWKLLEKCGDFGILTKRIQLEYSDSYIQEETLFVDWSFKSDKNLKREISSFFKKQQKGCLIAWSDANEKSTDLYRQLILDSKNNGFSPIYYRLNDNGANYTINYFIHQLAQFLYSHTSDEKSLRDPLKYYKNNKSKLEFKTIVIIHDLHIALFSSSHVSCIFNELYELEIPVLATSLYYPYLKTIANKSIDLRIFNSDDIRVLVESSMRNYIRFKGPNKEQESEKEAFFYLQTIVFKLFDNLQSDSVVVARRFADEYHFPIEYVHEAFAILSPFFLEQNEPFIIDEVDELYGFPKTIKESTSIFLALGRRDLKLEYKHKLLIKNKIK
jgi:hypothetical protein